MEDNATTRRKAGYPWGTLASNVAAVGAANFLGRMAGGLAIRGVAKLPAVRRRFGNLTPEAQSQLARRVGDTAMVGAALALRAQDLASQIRLEDAIHARLERLEGKMEKKAHVIAVYSLALENW